MKEVLDATDDLKTQNTYVDWNIIIMNAALNALVKIFLKR